MRPPCWRVPAAVRTRGARPDVANGDPGVRLIEPQPESNLPYFDAIVSSSSETALTALPLFHIYGSEELSVLAPSVVELAPKLYVMLHAEEARERALADGDTVAVKIDGTSIIAPLRTSESMACGVLGLPAGIPGAPYLNLPASAEIVRSAAP